MQTKIVASIGSIALALSFAHAALAESSTYNYDDNGGYSYNTTEEQWDGSCWCYKSVKKTIRKTVAKAAPKKAPIAVKKVVAQKKPVVQPPAQRSTAAIKPTPAQ